MSSYPLLFHPAPGRTIAWRDGAPVSVRTFLADVARVAAALPAGGHVFNVCVDRYRFAVGLCAALVTGRISLLPSTQTPEMVRQLASFAPDTFCLHDAADCAIELPRFRFPEPGAPDSPNAPDMHDDIAVPQIDASQVVAYVFTSGSTGAPVPHRKTWGLLVRCVRAAAERLGLVADVDSDGGSDAGSPTLIGTVPAQHMYGFESTVLLALIGGLAFSNRQPFYPADVRAELEAVPAPRVLVTTPVHLRALLAADRALPGASLILSATAPLPPTLAREAEARLAAPLIEIYGSTETGQIATRRTAQGDPWHLLAGVRLDTSPQAHGDGQDDSASNEAGNNAGNEAGNDGGPCAWASGGHIEAPVPMGDAIELLDDSHFLLHGRKTDLVNIAGKRTSLAYLNYQLNAIPGVEDGVFYMPDEAPSQAGAAADTGAAAKLDDCVDNHACSGPVTRLAALVVAPQLSAAELLHALRERIDAAFMPRPLRFVDALPRNATGKLPRDVLAMLVAQRPNEAQPSQENAAGRAAPLTFTIPADHPALPGHFPGQPIVPGVVLLDHALVAIGAALNRSFDRCRINSAKFLSPAAPGETLDVVFENTASGAIRFTVSAGRREVASGVLSAPTVPNAPTAPTAPTATQAHGAAHV